MRACLQFFFALLPFSVIPAKAGIHDADRRPVDPLLQGNGSEDRKQVLRWCYPNLLSVYRTLYSCKTKHHSVRVVFCGAPREARTPDLAVRSRALYPAELGVQMFCYPSVLVAALQPCVMLGLV